MRCAAGSEAVAELRGLRRSTRWRAERPPVSSHPTVEPLPLPGATPSTAGATAITTLLHVLLQEPTASRCAVVACTKDSALLDARTSQQLPCACTEAMAAAGAEGYANRYRNGWGASVAAVRAAVEEARRNKRHAVTPASQMAAPLPLSRFAWPVTPVRAVLGISELASNVELLACFCCVLNAQHEVRLGCEFIRIFIAAT